MVLIDAKECVLGRIAAYAAKQALNGEDVKIINCEKAIITGDKNFLISKYVHKMNMGTPRKGPFIPRRPDMLMRRTIRGMLPCEKARGREALKRVKCFIGVPDELKNEKSVQAPNAHISKLTTQKFMSMEELCHLIGGIKRV